MGGDISAPADELRAHRHPDHRPQHGRLDHRRTSTSSSPTRSRPARWRSWPSPTRPPSTSPASAAGGTERAARGRRRDAHRDLERQLAQGPPGDGRALAGARRAGRPADPGDEARRRRRAGHALRDGRLRAGPPRRGALERGGDRRPRRAGRRRTSSRTSATGRSATAGRAAPVPRRRRGRLRPVRRGADGRRDRSSGDPGRQPLRAERAGRRLAVLRGQAALVRAARALARRDAARPTAPSSSAATSTSPRPTTTSGTRRPSTAGPTSRSRSGRRSGRSSTGAWSTPTGRATPSRGRFTWWDYRAGNFHKNLGMRIDHLLLSAPLAARVVGAEIDREARKGPPIPSDHAPLVVDLDEPGRPFDADWAGALARIAARTDRRAGRGDGRPTQSWASAATRRVALTGRHASVAASRPVGSAPR